METISSRLKHARRASRMTMQALADRLGVSSSAIAQYEAGKSGITLDNAVKIADVLGISLEWLVSGANPTGLTDFSSRHYAPIVSRVQAGMWADVVHPPTLPEGLRHIELDNKPVGFALALELDGESMLPEFKPGDIVVIDTGLNPIPGDFVAALVDNDNQATFKKFRPRGFDDDGHPVIELAPLNPDYPTLQINVRNPGRIVGTMIEHRRYRRRK